MGDQQADPQARDAEASDYAGDLAQWGFRPRDRDPDTKTVSARVPVPVATAWTKAVDEVAARTGLTKGAVTGIGLLVAMQHGDDWRKLAASAGSGDPEESPSETS